MDWQGRLGTEACIGKKILRAQDRLSEHFNEHSRVVLDSVAVLMEALETHARWVSETLVSSEIVVDSRQWRSQLIPRF